MCEEAAYWDNSVQKQLEAWLNIADTYLGWMTELFDLSSDDLELLFGENGEEITPSGGFPHYGVIKNSYVLIHGSIPGPAKRLISMRDAIRYQRGVKVEKAEISYISTTSKQGV